ncbi:hypothetical protein EJ06DRAFT_533853 [Trichodelitschia bisporula]|uniref:Uncharacterized protein n=1 Tax=Trichodelitschia bisporula TaxID=703511 RepID=A0A6G1HKJ4_9PEZI|nr:hypothetical protein EJ06DRAFT_533853 [Trichodelitschia bisporula]
MDILAVLHHLDLSPSLFHFVLKDATTITRGPSGNGPHHQRLLPRHPLPRRTPEAPVVGPADHPSSPCGWVGVDGASGVREVG